MLEPRAIGILKNQQVVVQEIALPLGGICVTAVLICFYILLLANATKRAGAILGLSAVPEPRSGTTPLLARQEPIGDPGPSASAADQAGPHDIVPASNHRSRELGSLPNRPDQIVNEPVSIALVEPETAKVIRKSRTLSIRLPHRSFARSGTNLYKPSGWFQ